MILFRFLFLVSCFSFLYSNAKTLTFSDPSAGGGERSGQLMVGQFQAH